LREKLRKAYFPDRPRSPLNVVRDADELVSARLGIVEAVRGFLILVAGLADAPDIDDAAESE
jgi:hypothetical protein